MRVQDTDCTAATVALDVYKNHGGSKLEAQNSIRDLSILVLEDSYGDYDALRRALSRMTQFGVTITRAKTIEEARLAFRTSTFDVAFIDYNLGTESGLVFFHEIGGRASQIVPILVTGLLDHRVQDAALQAGAFALVNKADISATLLESTIRAALHSRAVEAEMHRLITTLAG